MDNDEVANDNVSDSGDSLQSQTLALNQQILDELKKLNAYNEAKEKAEAYEKKQAAAQEKALAEEQEKADQKAQEEAEEQAKIDADEQAEKEEAQQTQEEVYTELLTNIRDDTNLNYQINAVNGLYIGIVIGLLFVKILWDRLKKL